MHLTTCLNSSACVHSSPDSKASLSLLIQLFCKPNSGTIWGKWHKGQGVDLASQFPRSHPDWGPTSQTRGLKGSAANVLMPDSFWGLRSSSLDRSELLLQAEGDMHSIKLMILILWLIGAPKRSQTNTRELLWFSQIKWKWKQQKKKENQIYLKTSVPGFPQEIHTAWKCLISYLSANLTCQCAHAAILLLHRDAFALIYRRQLSATQHKGEVAGLITF